MTKAEHMVKCHVKLPNDLNMSVDFPNDIRFGDVSLVETTYHSSVSVIFLSRLIGRPVVQ